jgi:hypothetical protein
LKADGSPTAGMTAGIAFDSKYHDEKFRDKFTKHEFSLFTNCSDKAESMDLIQHLKGYLLADLIAGNTLIEGIEFKFVLKFCMGDNSEQGKELKKTAKKKRCPHCDQNFDACDSPHIQSLQSI